MNTIQRRFLHELESAGGTKSLDGSHHDGAELSNWAHQNGLHSIRQLNELVQECERQGWLTTERNGDRLKLTITPQKPRLIKTVLPVRSTKQLVLWLVSGLIFIIAAAYFYSVYFS